jgi:glycosyltransferase involved in cell wall biosynthesis
VLNNISVIFEDSRYGGPHSQFCNLAKILKTKVNFKILISNLESNFFEKKLNNINIKYQKKKIFFLSSNKKNIINYFIFFLKDIILIIHILNKNNSEYVYLPGGSSCFKSVIASLLLKKKIIWHIHDAHSNFCLRFIFLVLSIFVWKIIFASKKSFDFYPNYLGQKKIKILQSAVFKKHIKRKILKKKMNVALVANFNPIKNIELFLKIVNMYKNNKKFFFYLIGQVWNTKADYYLKCKKIIENNDIKNLKIYNKIPNKFYNKIHLLLCTSLSESSPLSLWEAVSANIPIITTDIGDIKILNKKIKFAYVINKKNPTLFYDKINYLFNNTNKYLYLSNQCKYAYRNFFDIKNYGKYFLNFFKN